MSPSDTHTHTLTHRYTRYAHTHTHTPLLSSKQGSVGQSLYTKGPAGRTIDSPGLEQKNNAPRASSSSKFSRAPGPPRGGHGDLQTFDLVSHTPICRHFAAATLLQPFCVPAIYHSIELQLGMPNGACEPPPLTPPSHHCDCLDDRQIDGQTCRQTERQKEGR